MAKLEALNPTVTSRLDELTRSLVDKCGNNLVALVVHGSAVHGGWRDGISDVDLTLDVPDKHKRVRIEQELREIRIRMRRVATDMSGHANFGGAIDRKVKQARAPLLALLALRGQAVDDTLEATLRESGKAYAIDVAPLRRAHEQPELAFQTLARLLDAALADVDRRDEGESQVT